MKKHSPWWILYVTPSHERKLLEDEIRVWMKNRNMNYKYDSYWSTIEFDNLEDKILFILRWM